jgi:hypothetical protein
MEAEVVEAGAVVDGHRAPAWTGRWTTGSGSGGSSKRPRTVLLSSRAKLRTVEDERAMLIGRGGGRVALFRQRVGHTSRSEAEAVEVRAVIDGH